MIAPFPKPRFYPKSEESERMTLIAAWPVKDGVVIHADSQETVGEYRVEVNKLHTRKIGDFQVLLAGAGNGKLVDSLAILLERQIATVREPEKFHEAAEQALAEFYRNDMNLFRGRQKEVKFFIAAYHIESHQFDVWVTKHIRLAPIPTSEPVLFGCVEPLYINIAKRFFSVGMNRGQAVLAGIYLFQIAEATSNFIRRPFRVAIIGAHGIWEDNADSIARIGGWVEKYERELNKIFLACADTGVSVHRLEDQLAEFSQTVLHIHRQQMDKTLETLTWKEVLQGDDAYRKFPAGVKIGFHPGGRMTFDHEGGRESEAEQKKFLRWDRRHTIPMQCSECQTVSDVPAEAYFEQLRSFTSYCETCKKETAMNEIIPSEGN